VVSRDEHRHTGLASGLHHPTDLRVHRVDCLFDRLRILDVTDDIGVGKIDGDEAIIRIGNGIHGCVSYPRSVQFGHGAVILNVRGRDDKVILPRQGPIVLTVQIIGQVHRFLGLDDFCLLEAVLGNDLG